MALDKAGYSVDALVSRSLDKAEKISRELRSTPLVEGHYERKVFSSDIVFIATQDSEIESVVDELSQKEFGDNTVVFHTSGSKSSDVLDTLRAKGCSVGSIHPLVAISDSFSGVERFRDAYFCVEGDEDALVIAKEIVKTLGGESFSIESEYKSLYHAAAVMTAGHVVSLLDSSIEMLTNCGLDSTTAKDILLPLLKSTINNLEQQKNSTALTGTFARGDLETMEKHIASINEFSSSEILDIYLGLGERSLKLAKGQGADAEKLAEMAKKISLAKKNSKC